ncbi:hypothetical protein [Dactylosporangium sp. CA-233914]|uniref:hypothetical protein n=1 Tax=Dactylosporangium sp. CA-233914 TaxID=3239934 RepID=UPI003D8BA315
MPEFNEDWFVVVHDLLRQTVRVLPGGFSTPYTLALTGSGTVAVSAQHAGEPGVWLCSKGPDTDHGRPKRLRKGFPPRGVLHRPPGAEVHHLERQGVDRGLFGCRYGAPVNTRRANPWVLGTAAALLLPLLCCGGPIAAAKLSEFVCRHRVETARKTVRTDSQPIRAELAPLGGAAEVHWVLDPNRSCDVLPVPGTDRDYQYGVVKIDPVKASDLAGRYAGWETVRLDAIFGDGGPLSPYIPSGGTWQHVDELDTQFVGAHSGEEASYYVNVDKATVMFSSRADHG